VPPNEPPLDEPVSPGGPDGPLGPVGPVWLQVSVCSLVAQVWPSSTIRTAPVAVPLGAVVE
jgi:hypothetical protein